MPITLRPDLAGLVPYDPDMRPADVVLTANENNYGLPAAVRACVDAALAAVETNRYPEATSPALREALGALWGVPARSVVVGNGGDEIIFNLLLAFGGPTRPLVTCPPTFSAYELYARLTQTPVVSVPRTAGFGIDEPAVLAAARSAGIVILCSPNNPTGMTVRPAFVAALAEATDALVMVDEAYGEFADPAASCVPLVATHDNVCVLRTLSKAYAMAGARVGYLVAPDAVADGMLAVRLPYSVNRFSQAAALAVVESAAELAPVTAAIVAERGRLAALLDEVAADLAAAGAPGMETFPSEANFVLVRLPGAGGGDAAAPLPDAHEVHELLARAGILVRDFSSTAGCEGCLRVSVGRPAETDALVAELRRILGLAPRAGRDGGRPTD